MATYYQDKTAFIFGASEGIGASVVRALAEEGANVLAFSRNSKKLEALRASIKNSSSRVQTENLDVTDAAAVQDTLARAVQKHGVPFFVMNFAGYARPGFIDQLELSEFRRMMDLNFFGTANVVKTLAPFLLEKKSGHIVNCSSMAGFLGLFGYTGYCASKFAVIGFSEALRREWAPYGIDVSVLCPPNTKTPGLVEENKHKPAEVLATEEKTTVLEPEAVAHALLKRLPRKEFLIVPSFDGKMANYLNRLSPKIIDFFIRRKDF